MKTPYTVEQLGIGRPLRWIVKGPGIVAEELHDEFFEIAQAHADRLNAAYQAGLQDQGVGVERIMEVKEGPSVEVIQKLLKEMQATLKAQEHAWDCALQEPLRGADCNCGRDKQHDQLARLSALFTQTQVEPVTWSDRDIDVAYLMGVINGASHEANGKTPWPSLDRVVQELERTKGQSAMIRDAVRSFKVPAKAIAADTPQAEGRGVEAESAVLEEHSPQQTQEGMGLPDGKESCRHLHVISQGPHRESYCGDCGETF